DSPEYRRISQALFIDLWNKNLIYEDNRPSFYCPACGTTIAEAEIYYEEKKNILNYIAWKIKETGEKILIATTRPELLCACGVVLVHPDDDRYKHLIGKHAIIPIYGREVEIKAHKVVDSSFGTGIVMMCSYGDLTDVQIFRELQLKPIPAINEEGRMTNFAGKYAGKTVEEARGAIIKDLKEIGALEKQEEIISRSPICERSKTPIEIILTKALYLKQLEFKEELKKKVEEMEIYTKTHKQSLLNWIDSLSIDWAISRDRYYHTEIPLWYCKKCGKAIVPQPGKYYRPWKEKCPVEKCECGSTEFVGDQRVFDTWMDSSISNLFVSLYLRDDEFFNKNFENCVRIQGRDIIRTWLYYTLLKSYLCLGKRPFKKVLVHGIGLDVSGRKMSKSLGNVIDPKYLIDKYGADAIRLWICGETKPGEDFRISEERIAGAVKTIIKIYNIAKYTSNFEDIQKPGDLKPTDQWILSELDALLGKCLESYEKFDFFTVANSIKNFIWSVYAPHYLEMSKARAYKKDPSAAYTLHTCLKTILKLLAPISPFFTDYIYRQLYGRSVHSETFPVFENMKSLGITEKLMEFNSQVWKTKKEKNIPLNQSIKDVKIPPELKPFEDDLVSMHKIEGIK
ncbi:MAG: class I tRNA ligase family protein, partial [archaeon]